MAHPNAFKIATELIIEDCNEYDFKRKYTANFGYDWVLHVKIWDMIKPIIPPKTKPKHLLWALMFLKVYNSEMVLSSWTGVTPKTFRKHMWPVVKAISEQAKQVVS